MTLGRSLVEIAPTVAISRAILAAAALAGTASLPVLEERCLGCRPSGVAWLDAFARWDGRWYVSVAETGYGTGPDLQSNLAFFPLYPAAMRILAAPFGADRAALVAAGIAVSLVALLVALAYLVRLARLDVDQASARRAVLYLLVYPTTILLTAVYAESMYVALAVGAFWNARQGRWPLAGVLSGLAALTRPFGVVVSAALAVEMATRGTGGRGAPWAWLALGPLALAGWATYLFALTGHPLAFLEAHGAWSVRPGNALGAVGDLFDPRVYGFPWAVAALLVLMTALAFYAWRIRPSYGVYCVLMLAAMASPGTLTSSMRHELGIFPAFVALGAIGARPLVHRAYVAVAGTMAVIFAVMFALSYWIG